MEVLGGQTTNFYTTVHTRENGDNKDISNKIETADLADGFHIYAMKWTARADQLVF